MSVKEAVHMASPEDMYVRGTVWYVTIWTYDPDLGKATGTEWSTRVKVSGKQGSNVWDNAKKRAMIEAGKHAMQLTLGVLNRKLTIADAYKANYDAKVNKKCAPATFEVLNEKWPHVQNHFGDTQLLKTITEQDITAFVTAMKKGATSPRGIVQTPGSCARVLKELFFGMRSVGVKPPTDKKLTEIVGQMHKGTKNELRRAQFAKLLAHSNPQWRDHMVAYRLTGMRKAELYLIEAKHVNIAEEMVTIPAGKSVNGGKDRTIPIHDQLLPILQRRVKQHPSGPLFEPWNNADRDLREAGVRAQVGLVSFNVLKASFGGEMLRAGVSTRDVATFYGHTSTRMVEEHYNQLKSGKHLWDAMHKVKSIAIPTDTNEEE